MAAAHWQSDSVHHQQDSSSNFGIRNTSRGGALLPLYKGSSKTSSGSHHNTNKNDSNCASEPLILEKEESTDHSKDNPNIRSSERKQYRSSILYIQNQAIFLSLQLLSYLKNRGDAILKLNSSTIEAPVPLDFITARLSKNHEREILKKQLQQQVHAFGLSSGIGWKLCRQLKHYKQARPGQRGMGTLSDAQILCFVDRQFDVSHLPAGIPSEISDMKQELNRLKSFSLSGWPAFKEQCKTGQEPEILAANGFFYMQDSDRVKCAFCLGVLFNWKSDESVPESHRLRFSTCPFLLGLDVGNQAILRPEADKSVRLSQMCSEDSSQQEGVSSAVCWAPDSARHPELECHVQLPGRPRCPVSAATAVAACRPGAADNLEMLGRSLHSAETAARYHPVQHPRWLDQRSREESLARCPLPVPSDQLASAGFFLDAELRTTCHWCGLRLLHWLPGDEPWIEHARWSPRCCHLLLERGHEFVLASRACNPPYLSQQPRQHQTLQTDSVRAAEDPEDSPSLAICSSSGGSNPLIDYRIEPRYFKAREDFPPALSILAVGCDPDDAKTAQFLQLKGTGDDFPNGEMFLHSVLSQFSRRQRLGLGGREFYEQAQREQALALAREPKPLGDDEVDWRACKVCMDRVINVTLLDCKHLCCCSTCVKQLDTCPLCRSPIRATMLVNMD